MSNQFARIPSYGSCRMAIHISDRRLIDIPWDLFWALMCAIGHANCIVRKGTISFLPCYQMIWVSESVLYKTVISPSWFAVVLDTRISILCKNKMFGSQSYVCCYRVKLSQFSYGRDLYLSRSLLKIPSHFSDVDRCIFSCEGLRGRGFYIKYFIIRVGVLVDIQGVIFIFLEYFTVQLLLSARLLSICVFFHFI